MVSNLISKLLSEEQQLIAEHNLWYNEVYLPKHLAYSRREYFTNILKWRVSRNKNALICIVGQTGSGKSWAALRLAASVNPKFTVEKGVCFTKDEVRKAIRAKEKVVIIDEGGATFSNRSWMGQEQKEAMMIFQAFRSLNTVTFVCVPYFLYLDKMLRELMHFLCETIQIDYVNKETLLKVHRIQFSSYTGKMYRRRLFDQKSDTPLLGTVVEQPPGPLLDAYEEKKNSAINEMISEKEADDKKEENKEEKQRGWKTRVVVRMKNHGYSNKEIGEMVEATPHTVSSLYLQHKERQEAINIAAAIK